MTFVSVADACPRLSIDAKTLRHWLADAHLPLTCHPSDGRKKGVSDEHVQVLARLHQRRLASSSEEGSVPLACQITMLPADLLSLPDQLATLQAQITALQQQVADLTRLLTQREPGPAIAPGPTVPSRTVKRPPRPTSPAPRSRPTAKTPHKLVHVIPRVEYGLDGRYVVICPTQGVLPFEPDSPAWFAWVAEQSSLRFVGKGGHFTAHHWWRVPRGAWRAHRHLRNHNYVLRLTPNHELTIAVLEQAAEAMHAHLK